MRGSANELAWLASPRPNGFVIGFTQIFYVQLQMWLVPEHDHHVRKSSKSMNAMYVTSNIFFWINHP